MSAADDASALTFETIVDEIGIEIGVYGEWRLKTVYRPIFARSGGALQAIGVKGATRVTVYGHEIDPDLFRSAVAPRRRRGIAVVEAALCLRNLAQTFVPGLKLVIDVDFGDDVPPARLRAGARALYAEVLRLGLDRADVLVCLSSLARRNAAALPTAASALRDAGVRVALAECGDGVADLPGPFADMVMIEAGWFAAVARQPSTAQLLGALVRSYRSRGATVLVEGIETAGQLAVALDCGADWLSGPLLAPAAPAGAVFPERPLDIDALLDRRRVIPLFR